VEPDLDWDISRRDWLVALGWGAIIGLAMVIQFAAYSAGEAAIVTAVSALYPVVTVLLAVMFYDESFNAIKGLAIAMALSAGVALSRETPASITAIPK
jgi:drug/metabolite transporter (DMT)-like permease